MTREEHQNKVYKKEHDLEVQGKVIVLIKVLVVIVLVILLTYLYGKYVGNWGSKSTQYRFEAIKDGEIVKEVTIGPMNSHSLKVDVNKQELVEGRTYDVAAVRITDRDEHGRWL